MDFLVGDNGIERFAFSRREMSPDPLDPRRKKLSEKNQSLVLPK